MLACLLHYLSTSVPTYNDFQVHITVHAAIRTGRELKSEAQVASIGSDTVSPELGWQLEEQAFPLLLHSFKSVVCDTVALGIHNETITDHIVESTIGENKVVGSIRSYLGSQLLQKT